MLRAALADGTIDAVVTDHAPHARRVKERSFIDAAFGILGLETVFSVVSDVMVGSGLLDWAGVARVMSVAPAWIGLTGHRRPIAVGEPANLTLVDPSATVTVDREASRSLSRNNPWATGRLSAQAVPNVAMSPPALAGWMATLIGWAGHDPSFGVDNEAVLGEPAARCDRWLHLGHDVSAGSLQIGQQTAAAVGRVAVDRQRRHRRGSTPAVAVLGARQVLGQEVTGRSRVTGIARCDRCRGMLGAG